MNFELSDCKAAMNSDGRSGEGSEDEIWRDGGDLENIIACIKAGLYQAGAVGVADLSKYEDGWYWEGFYEDSKPLLVNIKRRTGEEDYPITFFCELKCFVILHRGDFSPDFLYRGFP